MFASPFTGRSKDSGSSKKKPVGAAETHHEHVKKNLARSTLKGTPSNSKDHDTGNQTDFNELRTGNIKLKSGTTQIMEKVSMGITNDSDVDGKSVNGGPKIERDSILSPHSSVFDALRNPDLNRGVDIPSIDDPTYKVNLGKVHQTQFQFQFSQSNNLGESRSGSHNMDFSITSWQNVNADFSCSNIIDPESRTNSQGFTHYSQFNFPSDNDSNIISGNNSPYLKHASLFNNISSTTNVSGSPNAASILSSSSGHEDEKLVNDETVVQDDNASRHLQSDPKLNNTLPLDTLTLLGNEHEKSDVVDETKKMTDSSTVISSFVMPKVSIMSNSGSFRDQSNSFLSVRLFGDKDDILLSRFKRYKKIFNNIKFLSNNHESADLLILIVNKDNYMLPKMTKTPCIPIVLSKESFKISYKIPKFLKLCNPIPLKSLNDDLIALINFLDNINDLNTWNMFLQNLDSLENEGSNSLTIHDICSSLIELNTDLSSSSNNTHSSLYLSKLRKKPSKDDLGCTKDRKADLPFFNTYVIAGLTVSVVSVGFILIWKRLTLNSSTTARPITEDVSISSAYGPNEGYKDTFEKLILDKIHSFFAVFEPYSNFVVSGVKFLCKKVKVVFLQWFNF